MPIAISTENHFRLQLKVSHLKRTNTLLIIFDSSRLPDKKKPLTKHRKAFKCEAR